MTHVCMITTVHSNKDNRIYFKECKTLLDANYQLSLIASTDWKGLDERISLHTVSLTNGRIKRFIIVSFFQTLYNAIKINADIYHFHDPEIIPAALILRLQGKKVIFDIHELISESFGNKDYIPTKTLRITAQNIYKRLEEFAIRKFSALIVARPDIFEKYKEKNNVIPLFNYPNIPANILEVEKKYEKKEKYQIIYVGGMGRLRGTKTLIEAFSRVNNCELILLGKFSDEEFLDECKMSDGWSNVRYLGSVSADEVLDQISQADIGIITFLPAPNHLTTLATKPFEYMACGLPVIMSNFPYWIETFKNSAVFVDPENPDDIAENIIKLANDTEKMAKLGCMNKDLVSKKYNWTIESKKLLKLYEELCASL